MRVIKRMDAFGYSVSDLKAGGVITASVGIAGIHAGPTRLEARCASFKRVVEHAPSAARGPTPSGLTRA